MSSTTTQSDATSDLDPMLRVGELLHLDPGQIIIGANVRVDLRPDQKDFRRSIKQRGVLEAVTVYRDPDVSNGEPDRYVLLRGQRRVVTAAEVGTPTGLVPARVVPKPPEPDRIEEQMVENLHRAGMRETEIVAGVEQLTLLGVSAAQIAKRTSVPRATVDAALTVTQAKQTRGRFHAGGLTLADAAILAEFEDQPDAIERLECRRQWGHPLAHEAQRLRDEAAERAALDAECQRLRDEGLPVLSAGEIADAHASGEVLRIDQLLTTAGDPVPAEQWPDVPGARVQVVREWVYPENGTDQSAEDTEEGSEGHPSAQEPYQKFVPLWVVTDLASSGLRRRGDSANRAGNAQDDESDDSAEVRRAERRRVITNNKAWVSAETVRREWLAGFVSRKTSPQGAEALICESVLTGQHFLYKAMESNHPMLRTLLDTGAAKSRWDSAHEVAGIATKASTPKAAIMTTLAVVVTAWEDTTGKHTWRNPTAWDTRVLTALIAWGYEPSEVERILLGADVELDSDPEQSRQ